MALLIAETFRRIIELLLVPYYNNEVIWIIAPLLFVLVMIQMYFGRYKTEQLGWNTAFGNTASLMWVTVVLFKFLHDKFGGIDLAWGVSSGRGDVILVTILGVVTFVLAILDFYHVLPKKYAFLISSTLPLNALAFFTALIVVGKIPLDKVTFQASIVLLIFFVAVFYLYKKMITPAPTIVERLEKKEREKKKFIRKEERKVEHEVRDVAIEFKYYIARLRGKKIDLHDFRSKEIEKKRKAAAKKELEEKRKAARKKKN